MRRDATVYVDEPWFEPSTGYAHLPLERRPFYPQAIAVTPYGKMLVRATSDKLVSINPGARDKARVTVSGAEYEVSATYRAIEPGESATNHLEGTMFVLQHSTRQRVEAWNEKKRRYEYEPPPTIDLLLKEIQEETARQFIQKRGVLLMAGVGYRRMLSEDAKAKLFKIQQELEAQQVVVGKANVAYDNYYHEARHELIQDEEGTLLLNSFDLAQIENG